VTDTLRKRKRHVAQKGHLVGAVAILYAVAILVGLQVQTAGAQVTQPVTTQPVTHVTSVSPKPREHALSATGTSAREPTPSATGTAAREPTPSATGTGEPASSATRAAPAAGPKTVSKLAGRYFVDFRSRTAASYGHAFLWYGRLTASGKVHEIEVAGLHPATDSPVPYIIGHIFPVPSETGKSYGDLDEQYLTASYRVYLSEGDAKQVFAYIQHLQATSPLWLASVYNCTAFLADVARFMGMKAPATATWMYPETFVNTLRELNNGRTEIVLTPQSGDLFSRLMR
jgi:hypothetical protein